MIYLIIVIKSLTGNNLKEGDVGSQFRGTQAIMGGKEYGGSNEV